MSPKRTPGRELAADGVSLAAGDGPIGQAYASATAAALDPIEAPDGASVVSAVLAITLVPDNTFTEVLALYF